MSDIYRVDLKGQPFEFPACLLNQQEYAKIVSEINSDYELYKNEAFPVHYSIGIDNHYYLYFFENHGFNDYNIVEKFEF